MSPDTKRNPIIERIIQLRAQHFGGRGKSDFARKLGISPSTYNYYEQDRVPPADILLKMSKITGVGLDWLIAGESISVNTSNNSSASGPAGNIGRAVEILVTENPQIGQAISAFIEIICEKNNVENPLISSNRLEEGMENLAKRSSKFSTAGSEVKRIESKDESKVGDLSDESKDVGDGFVNEGEFDELTGEERMIPVLGRTAAGIVHCWDQCDEPGSWHAETKLAELVKKYIGKDIVCSNNSKVEVESGAVKLAASQLGGFDTNAYIVQVSDDDEGIVEFVDSSDIAEKYPDCFGLRVDGDSMLPRICDGDIVILSPSVRATQGSVAVAKVRDQIGVTCKIVRFDKGQVHLVAANENYETRVVDRSQLIWALAVLGHVKRR